MLMMRRFLRDQDCTEAGCADDARLFRHQVLHRGSLMLMVRSFCVTRIAQRRADADDARLFRHQVLHGGSRMLMMRRFLRDQDCTEAG